MTTEPNPLFTVIIPTRNRPGLFAIALQSVLEQRFPWVEVIVVNDGSAEAQFADYQQVLAAAPPRVRLLNLLRTERGHGQSYAVNFGVAQARGDYVCFLDDDDQWIDPDHLGRAADAIAASADRVDMVLANQRAFLQGNPVDREVWIESLQNRLRDTPDSSGAYTVTAAQLLLCAAHCHLNTTIVSRKFFATCGGMDEGLRYENDREFYLRAIDHARLIKFLPNIVARHNVPDPAARNNMSTAESEMAKRLYQLRVLDKTALFSARAELRQYAMRHRGYVLEHIAREADRAGRADCAAYYRHEARMVKLARAWSGLAGLFGSRLRSS